MRHPRARRTYRIRPYAQFIRQALRAINADRTAPPLAYSALARAVDTADRLVTASYRRIFGTK